MRKEDHPLRKAALRVLEDWGMMLVDEIVTIEADTFDPSSPTYMSWINLQGAFPGAVSIVAQGQFMRHLAGNLLGESDESILSAATCEDAFKEMGNVLAGNFLTEAYGSDVVFELIHPNVTQIPFTDVERFIQRNIVFAFVADESPVAVTFSLKK